MKLEVGEFYLSAGGEVIKITNKEGNIFQDGSDNDYSKNGTILSCDLIQYDLIAHIPKQLHYELIRVVNEYHTNKDFKSMIDINFDKRK